MEEMHQTAANLLTAIWRGISGEYKSRYRFSIWQQFEDNVRSAAYTNNLGKFVDGLCLKLGAQIGGGDVGSVEQILNSGNDRALLKIMREETTLAVLMVRVANQERQEERKKKRAEREAEEEVMRDPLFGLPKDKDAEEE